jgi:hypothetical protein
VAFGSRLRLAPLQTDAERQFLSRNGGAAGA